jgi:hypothetical protein
MDKVDENLLQATIDLLVTVRIKSFFFLKNGKAVFKLQ